MGLTSSGLDDIKLTVRRFVNEIPEATKEAIDESLGEGMFHSVDIVHVITGRLRDSIRTENVKEDSGDLVAGGTGSVNYADIEELGNSRREGHPYLRPGAEVAFSRLRDNVDKKIKDLF